MSTNNNLNKILLPTYSHISDCEKMVCYEARHKLYLQSADTEDDASLSELRKLFELVALRTRGTMGIPAVDGEWIIIQMENLILTYKWAQKCDCLSDWYRLFATAYRLYTGESWTYRVHGKIVSSLDDIFKSEVQAFDVGEVLTTLRKAFDFTQDVKETPLIKKLVSLYSYALTQGFLKKFGLTLNDDDYSKMEQRAMIGAFSSKKCFLMCILDTTLFICERIYEYKVTGNISAFIHSSNTYIDWIKECDRIIGLAPHVGNLGAHGTSYFTYLSDLRDLIEKGEAYCKYTSSSTGVDNKTMKLKLHQLKLQQNNEISRRAAQQERIQPMGVLVYGASSIAKSSFTKILFNYYGGLFDLDRDDHYRYVRNPMDEYWSNFDSSKWCIQLDDIAFKNPSKSNDIDSTLQDLLNVVNNVPYVPPQAALEDKGRTPVLAKLVIATTNCVTLNAQEYFWCPLAVRRRLPFVVTLRPKKEFLHENRSFIDPSKLTNVDGQFPDFWNITVSKIVPVLQGDRELAELKIVNVFEDINEFLQFFGKACKEHERNQLRAMSKDVDMKEVSICKLCLKPLPHDECNKVELQYSDTTWMTLFAYLSIFQLGGLIEIFVNILIQYKQFMHILDCLAYYRLTRSIAFGTVNYITDQVQAMNCLGRLCEKMRDQRIQKMLLAGTLMVTALGLYVTLFRDNTKKNASKKDDAEEVNDAESVASDDSYMEDIGEGKIIHHIYEPGKKSKKELKIQGNKFSTTEKQLQREERSNVWYNPDMDLTTFEVPIASSSIQTMTHAQIRDVFSKNCVLLLVKVHGENITRTIRGVFIKGHICLTNGHAFKNTDKDYKVTICTSSVLSPLSSNLEITISRNDIVFSPNNDVCVFEVASMPPYKDITKYWVEKDISPSMALELSRELDGTISQSLIYSLDFIPQLEVDSLEGKYDVFMGQADRITEQGHCGSLCVALTPRGPIIIGIHFLGYKHNLGILKIKSSEINNLLKDNAISHRPIIQAGYEPKLSCNDKTHIVGEPHHKSLFRYLEKGTLNMYGSFQGFRSKPKSKVCGTPLQKEFLEHYGRKVQFGKPCMEGWEPWRKNVIEMVKPNVNYNRSYLKKCVASYTNDILNNLPNDWEKDLVILSNKACINGLPGVKFIDRIACSTSMGFPWACTKKKYLVPDICDNYPEGVDFVPEVWDRVSHIESEYREGRRVYPVFTGHLKDEATPLKKCEIKKTRLFTGAPVDWSLVVRKNLLSFVRLLQKNKYIFEAGPGTVAQSAEWGQIYDYLTHFGADRIVAGDYGKFDKRMLSDFILAAFEVIVNIHREAGFSEEECRTIMCIGEDTAFPLSNINGDLVEFFGTNPSGHPLTVVINSLVNSLYMRYCYISLNPDVECDSFKKNVHLFTYGDDNIMGVNTRITWFNHTAIQKTLENIGVEYTMADKESESVPFVHISQVSFLKRKWLWNEDVQNWTCPLEEDSLIKQLTVWVPSSSIDKYKQMVQSISTANSEYFFYGREKFEEKHKFFKQLLEREPYSFYVNESTLPSYDILAEKFMSASRAL